MISRIQEQFLVNSMLYDGAPVYNIATLTRVTGTLDLDRLSEAWRRVWTANDIFRFQFTGVGHHPEWVSEHGPAPWQVWDETEASVPARASIDADTTFDSSAAGPLVRFAVYRLGNEVNYIHIVLHHSVTDLFSKDLLADQLSRCYANPDYCPSGVPYSRYMEAEQAWLGTPAAENARAFWKKKMASGYETLRLPAATWKPRPFSARGRRARWAPSEVHSALLAGVEAEGRSAFLILLTAYALVLSRASGQRTFLLGVPLTNRVLLTGEPVAGPCVNILPVLVDVSPEETFADVYRKLRVELLENHRHQSLPFLDVLQLAPSFVRDPLRPPVIQAGFAQEPPLHLDLVSLECQPVFVERAGAQMDLFFTWWNRAGHWEGHWEYNSDSFGEAEITLWQESFDRFVEIGLTSPEQLVSRVRLISDERLKALVDGPHTDYPLDNSLSGFLRESYRKHCDQPALVWHGQATSYADFEAGVARIAASLHEDYGTKGRIIVLLDRSPLMLFALHGIAQSGNSYVPIGVDWPITRIDDILADIEPVAVLTEPRHREKFQACRYPVLDVTTLLQIPDGTLPEVQVLPTDALYILYTSGTTGRPKGTELPHVAILNHLFWMQEKYQLEVGERCLLKTPYTFDVSMWELFWPLAYGATLVISDESSHRDPREILDIASTEKVNRLVFVPSLLEPFLDQDGLNTMEQLRNVHCIGEALPLVLLKKFLDRLPGVRIHNLYGPTEAAVSVTDWECSFEDVDRGIVPIGRPMANTQIYVVDSLDQPCAPLMKGEILIGGTCLATQYWRRPELTQDKFFPNPFGPGRLYRTGDWGRWALDGAIEYLERRDTQIKIRGVRVELGEIESVLRRVEGVENAVVKKGRGPNGLECLIAYYTLQKGHEVEPATLRSELRRHLPEALVPDHLRFLAEFPVNENGKLDRNALLDRIDSDVPIGVTSALEGVEGAIASLWERVLGRRCEDPGLNFFDSGGNSISLLSLRTLLEDQFRVPVKITQLFQHPTISAMAELLTPAAPLDTSEEQKSDRVRNRLKSIQAIGRRNRDVR